MGRNALVLQPFGLGDCIFAQTLVKSMEYDRIFWPVTNQYFDDLRNAYPDIIWMHENMDIALAWWYNDVTALPIRYSDTIMNVPYHKVMRAKYDMYRLPYQSWSEQAMWKRNTPKEYSLLEALGINPGDEFNLVSMNYTSNFKAKPLSINNGLRNINLNPIQGYSLFDWAALMERATEIHFVASSSLYMLECLSLQAKKIYIYQREIHEQHNRYDYLFNKHKYIWV
jgi:hypothetical protein